MYNAVLTTTNNARNIDCVLEVSNNRAGRVPGPIGDLTMTLHIPSNLAVKAILISGPERINALPRYFSTRAMRVEHAFFEWMGALCTEYRGGLWSMYQLSNGGFFMAPPDDVEKYRVRSTNGYTGDVSSEAMGVIVCLFAYSHLSFQSGFDVAGVQFHKLRAYALDHREATAIFAAID